jgi:outer membrane protein
MEKPMKKLLATLACAAALTTTASADILRAEIGAGMWMPSATGNPNKDLAAAQEIKADEAENAQPYVWAFVKHPLPIVPNLRLEYVNVKSGTVNASNISANVDVSYTQFDVIPYYNLLDNTFWITLDVGIDVKSITEKRDASPTDSYNIDESKAVVIPMGYVRGRVQVPVTGFGVEADVKYISFDDNTVYDARAKVDYTLNFIPVIQPAIEIGYRVQKFETKELLGQKMSLDFAGVYAGVFVRF